MADTGGRGVSLTIKPITFREASEYIAEHHRHHRPTVGSKFSLSVYDGNRICGVAVSGRPVSRHLDDGETLEINRVATDGTKNACSCLYGACVRVAKAMGYKRVITYTLQSEPGTSLMASGFKCDGSAGGTHWTGVRDRGQNIPAEKKVRWSKEIGT